MWFLYFKECGAPNLEKYMHVCNAKLLQSCLTLCNSMDCSPLGSFVHGILQVRILEWVAMLSSRGSSQPRDGTQVSCIAGRFSTAEPPGKPKKHLQLKNKKRQMTQLKGAKDLNRHFSKEDVQVAHKCMKRCATSWTIREMPVKTTMINHFIIVRWP